MQVLFNDQERPVVLSTLVSVLTLWLPDPLWVCESSPACLWWVSWGFLLLDSQSFQQLAVGLGQASSLMRSSEKQKRMYKRPGKSMCCVLPIQCCSAAHWGKLLVWDSRHFEKQYLLYLQRKHFALTTVFQSNIHSFFFNNPPKINSVSDSPDMRNSFGRIPVANSIFTSFFKLSWSSFKPTSDNAVASFCKTMFSSKALLNSRFTSFSFSSNSMQDTKSMGGKIHYI